MPAPAQSAFWIARKGAPRRLDPGSRPGGRQGAATQAIVPPPHRMAKAMLTNCRQNRPCNSGGSEKAEE